ncbi:MAG: hypothetical protein HOI47_00980 [Candidatus Scalindua sp.]|jgi:4-hydroxy 2-oxovalerate aldolase|nr:hypothetical protein [Candidatus Scalindua sp.]
MSQLPKFKILDCTIRDGGYINNWKFDKKLIREVYKALSKCGVDYVEIGFRGTEKHFDKNKYGSSRFSKEEDIQEAVANIKGAKLALMADYGKIGSEDFCESNNSVVDLVRVAVHKNNVKGAIKLLEQIKNKGYQVSLNAMGYANYSESERKNLVDLLKSAELDYIYVADSYGSLFPNQIMQIFEPLLSIENINVGFHPHNNLQMAFANTIEAIRCGVYMIDCTVYGMGRAAGNLPTEIIISFLEKESGDKYNSIPVLNIIDRYFVSLQKENMWGYQLPYMLSGMFQCHPDYAKALVDFREYTIEDIWKAMDYINKKEPVGFSKSYVDEVINEGVIGNIKGVKVRKHLTTAVNEFSGKGLYEHQSVPYINRHKNRDFLILANGPSLKEYKSKIEKFITKFNPIILGANYLGGIFKPYYHAFNNKRRFAEYIDTVIPESKLLIGQYMSEEMIREYTDKDYERIFYLDILNSEFDVNNGVIMTNCRTISVLLLGIATVMGANRIFAAGMDGYIGLSSKSTYHFYDERDEKENQEMIMERHHWNQIFIEQIDNYLINKGKEGLHILTPTGYKSFYKGIDNYI